MQAILTKVYIYSIASKTFDGEDDIKDCIKNRIHFIVDNYIINIYKEK